jgi:ATP-dependent Lon protease
VLADMIAQLLKVDIDKKQQVLETSDVVTRLETVLAWMKAGAAAA